MRLVAEEAVALAGATLFLSELDLRELRSAVLRGIPRKSDTGRLANLTVNMRKLGHAVLGRLASREDAGRTLVFLTDTLDLYMRHLGEDAAFVEGVVAMITDMVPGHVERAEDILLVAGLDLACPEDFTIT